VRHSARRAEVVERTDFSRRSACGWVGLTSAISLQRARRVSNSSLSVDPHAYAEFVFFRSPFDHSGMDATNHPQRLSDRCLACVDSAPGRGPKLCDTVACLAIGQACQIATVGVRRVRAFPEGCWRSRLSISYRRRSTHTKHLTHRFPRSRRPNQSLR